MASKASHALSWFTQSFLVADTEGLDEKKDDAALGCGCWPVPLRSCRA